MSILNRRHLFIREKGCESISVIIEKIDSYIASSKFLDFTTYDVVIYGNSWDELSIGREVLGYDSDIEFQESLELRDYPATLSKRVDFDAHNYYKLEEEVKKGLKREGAVLFRLKTSTFVNFRLDIFT